MKKKVILGIVAVVILLLAAFELTMEHRFSAGMFVPANMTESEILSEKPEIAISEEDHALEAYVLALPQVQEMLGRTADSASSTQPKTESLPAMDAATLLQDWAKPGWHVLELCTIGSTVYVSFREDNGESICIYTFFPDKSSPMDKTIGMDLDANDDWDCTTIYENHNGKLTKYVDKHQWFSWIRYFTQAESSEPQPFGRP